MIGFQLDNTNEQGTNVLFMCDAFQIIDIQAFVPPDVDPEIGLEHALDNNTHSQYKVVVLEVLRELCSLVGLCGPDMSL
jgi:hypothetical protein